MCKYNSSARTTTTTTNTNNNNNDNNNNTNNKHTVILLLIQLIIIITISTHSADVDGEGQRLLREAELRERSGVLVIGYICICTIACYIERGGVPVNCVLYEGIICYIYMYIYIYIEREILAL